MVTDGVADTRGNLPTMAAKLPWQCWQRWQIYRWVVTAEPLYRRSRERYTAKEGPVRIQYKCLVPIYICPEMKLLFPKQNYNVLSRSSRIHISARDVLYIGISRISLLQGNIWTYPGNISLTDTWMWKLGLKPPNSQKRITYMGFYLQCGVH